MQAIRRFIEYIRVPEPDTLSCISLQENEHAAKFVHIFIYRDANSEGVDRFTSTLYPNLMASVEFTEYQVFADTGPALTVIFGSTKLVLVAAVLPG